MADGEETGETGSEQEVKKKIRGRGRKRWRDAKKLFNNENEYSTNTHVDMQPCTLRLTCLNMSFITSEYRKVEQLPFYLFNPLNW